MASTASPTNIKGLADPRGASSLLRANSHSIRLHNTKPYPMSFSTNRLFAISFAVLLAAFCITGLCHSDANAAVQESDSELDQLYKVVKWRNIGPFRGGRSVCASGVIGDSQTYFMGTTGGGLWKTTDAGQHWGNVSDGFFKTGSVGAVAVS